MKRILLEILLVLGLAGSGYFGWTQRAGVAALEPQVSELTEKVDEATKSAETAQEELAKTQEALKAAQPATAELNALKAGFENGEVLKDLEGLYAKQKNLTAERQLGLALMRMVTKGSQDPSAVEALQKTLDQVDWKGKQKIICATQNALSAAGKDVKVLAECYEPPVKPAEDKKADEKADEHGKDGDKSKDKHAGAPHWEYEGALGPDNWGKEFPTCAKGQSQAPLNIKGPFAKALYKLAPDYKPGPLNIVNNGHTIQVNVPPGSKLRVDSKPYELVQFHFHRPSEEQLDGKPMDMVIHFVHKNDEGALVVMGVLVKAGNENPGIKTLWEHAPAKEGPAVSPDGVVFNPMNLLPREMDYFTYEGSLTTPPCTEKVRFFIMKSVVNISSGQLAQFPFKMNARPVQPLNKRIIETN
jgi:carbonic anhydrase